MGCYLLKLKVNFIEKYRISSYKKPKEKFRENSKRYCRIHRLGNWSLPEDDIQNDITHQPNLLYHELNKQFHEATRSKLSDE